MGGSVGNVDRSHPCFGVCVVQRIQVHRDVAGDDEPVCIVRRDCNLNLAGRLAGLIHQYVDLLAVCDGLAALRSPNEQSFVRIDV